MPQGFDNQLQQSTVERVATQNKKLRKLLTLPDYGSRLLWWRQCRFNRWAAGTFKVGRFRWFHRRKKQQRFQSVHEARQCPRCSGWDYYPGRNFPCWNCNYPNAQPGGFYAR